MPQTKRIEREELPLEIPEEILEKIRNQLPFQDQVEDQTKEREWQPEELRLPLYENFDELQRTWIEQKEKQQKEKQREEEKSRVIIIQM